MADNNLEELKLDLVSEIQQRVTDKISERSNADLLIKLINQAETETEAMNIAALGTTYKRTGFHFDKRLEKISNNIKYKAKNDRLSFVNDKNRPTHELIIGDNYDALQNLLITHKGKIDVIYIDPPYGKDNMGDFAKTNYNNSITRDNLLSMLYPRLLMAKRLLTPEGVIFCSIDDKNQAYVKCLFDEVFGEENFVANFVWKKKQGGGNDSKFVIVEHEYILCYAKISDCTILGLDTEYQLDDNLYPFNDDKGDYGLITLDKTSIQFSPSLVYEIVDKQGNKYWPRIVKGKQSCWRWGKQKVKEHFDDLVFKKGKVYTKYYRPTGITPKSLLIDSIYGRTESGNDDISSVFTDERFKYPKPIALIRHFMSIGSQNKNSIILDFFAGSGTTGQAVMELNKEDGGNRTFILCTNNEITDKTPNGIAYDVTAKRLKRVMSGECYDGTNNFPWLEDHEPYRDNLNVYEIETVSKTEYRVGETAFDKIDETCYGLPKFEKLTDKIEWVCKNFENATKMEGDKSC